MEIRVIQYYILYFFLYSLIGWMLEVFVIAVGSHKFANRGLLNLPLCISYGLIMDLLIMATQENTKHGFIMFFLCLVTVSAVEFIAGSTADRYARRRLWDYMNISAFGGQWKGLLNSLVISFGFFTCLKLVHPFVFLIVRLIPGFLRLLLCCILSGMLALDLCSLQLAKWHSGKNPPRLEGWQENVRTGKRDFGKWISTRVIRRIEKAYPAVEMNPPEENAGSDASSGGAAAAETPVFAQGMCFDKAVWIMLFFGLVGNVCETLLVRYQTGIWMRRGSLVFIPISLVWGLGGVLFTLLLQHFAKWNDRYVFIGGFFFGGAYEYLCSVFTETFLGTRFWDYHGMPFNIDGRTNLLFMFIWGTMALVWIKLGYPKISSQIEKITPAIGKAATWVMVFLLSVDILLSGAVILRSAVRMEHKEASNFLEEYIDRNFPDEIVKRNWRNIRFGPNAPDEPETENAAVSEE